MFFFLTRKQDRKQEQNRCIFGAQIVYEIAVSENARPNDSERLMRDGSEQSAGMVVSFWAERADVWELSH